MATILATSSLTDEPSTSLIDNKSTLGKSPTIDNDTSLPLLLKKKDSLVVTALREGITKTAVVDDIYDEDQQVEEHVEEEGEEEVDEEYIADKLFHLQTGFKKSKSVPVPAQRGDILALSIVQELKLIHKPLTENFHMLVRQLQHMRGAAYTVHSEDLAYLETVVSKCERVYSSHQAFGKVLEFEPSHDTVIRALYTLVELSAAETTELIQEWAAVYQVLLDLGHSILSHHASGSQHKSPSLSRMQLLLLHEPVAVNDSQISSTPDVTEIQRYMVMVCFYNQTSYILKVKTGEERDAWVKIARELRIEQPKPSDACREQDENEIIQRSVSSGAIVGDSSKHKGSSLFKRLRGFRRSTTNLPEAGLHSPEIHPDQVTYTQEDEHARRMQLGQPSLWEVRRLPTDLGVIPPLEHPIPFRRDNMYDTNVKIVDMTTGKVAPGEFGMGIEDRAAYHRDGCALFAVLRPPRLVKPEDVDKNREDFFLVGKRTVNGRDYCAEPPYITDFYARSWLHPNMRIEFDIEASSVVIANMYRILCSSPKMVHLFETYYRYLMTEAKISPDNTFLCMDYRSYPLR
ncbi:hypothetical protein BGZ52_004686, partial [Haplosporangium bisporale]